MSIELEFAADLEKDVERNMAGLSSRMLLDDTSAGATALLQKEGLKLLLWALLKQSTDRAVGRWLRELRRGSSGIIDDDDILKLGCRSRITRQSRTSERDRAASRLAKVGRGFRVLVDYVRSFEKTSSQRSSQPQCDLPHGADRWLLLLLLGCALTWLT